MLRFQQVLIGAALSGTLLFSVRLAAQAAFTDPANLRGERVKPHDGRELPIDQGARGLEQMLRKLNTRASLMFIVAHPDDEDGGMLTYCSRGLGARVAVLTLTRGEGGQNAVTGDFEDALGLLRTQELLAADRYFGVDQMFGTEVDFGFSKTKEEAFSKWTHERVLYDAVRAVRLYRPMVIAATFIGGVTDGHGQHQVSGEIAQEVFKAAGDPKVFPELAKEGILPWQPLKVYARVPRGAITSQGLFDYATNQYAPAKFVNYVTGEVTTTAPTADVVVHEGKPDPLLSAAGESSTSYVQFARVGLGQQKSQIGTNERVPPAGVYDVSYHRYGSRLSAQKDGSEASFFDGIDTSVASIQTLLPSVSEDLRKQFAKLSLELEYPTHLWGSKSPEEVAPNLASAMRTTDGLISEVEKKYAPEIGANTLHELRVKRAQINDALVLALGLSIRADTPTASVSAGTSVSAREEIRQTSSEAVRYLRGSSEASDRSGIGDGSAGDGTPPWRLAADHPLQRDCGLGGDSTRISRPYFSRKNIEQSVYDISVPEFRNAAGTPAALTCWNELEYKGVRFRLGAVAGHERQPVSFNPPASLLLSAHAQIYPSSESSVNFFATLSPVTNGPIVRTLKIGKGWQTGLGMGDMTVPGQTALQIKKVAANAGPTLLQASVKLPDGTTINEGYRLVGYEDLPRTNFYTPATVRVVPAELKLPSHARIAYLPGTGDGVPSALSSIGLTATVLSVADVNAQKLAEFDTVVLGVRTYAAHPELHGAPTKALLAFARSGGNVVLQYQTSEFTGDDAPFPLDFGNAEKVVDETDTVRLLDPSAASLSTPNRLNSADFHGWVEERGHGFLQTWDTRYTALTETSDPGQEPQRGGWITTRIGRGHWSYCAYALYRQLPEAVPGAYRILMNQLALADER